MQNYDNQSGVSVDQTGEVKVLPSTFVQAIWNKFKVCKAGKHIKKCFDALCTTYFPGKIIQGAVGYLNRHPSVDYAIKITVEIAAIFMICGVALECVHLLRPFYWMIANFFISALKVGTGMVFVVICFFWSCLYAILNFMWIFTIRVTTGIFSLICHIFIILWAVLKFLVFWISGITLIYLLSVWIRLERRKSISQRSDTGQQPHTSTGATRKVISPNSLTCNNTLGLNCDLSQCPTTPYRWQFKESDSSQLQWKNFGPSDNTAIEKLYCDVQNLQVNMVPKDTYYPSKDINVMSPTITVDFEQMSMQLDTTVFSLRRNALSTTWIWYWEDDDGWKKYAETKQSSGAKQEDIEAAYLNKDRVHLFRIGTLNYKIRFNKAPMYQRNMDPRFPTKRSVRRRPLSVSESVLQTTEGDPMSEGISSERIPMHRDGQEFKTVSERFHKTMPERKASIQMVEKIDNAFLRERYNRKREQMKKVLKASNYNEIEKLLFHGTTFNVIDAICKQNFDHRMPGKNGTLYGQGSYFAVDASYSNNYSSQSGEKTRFMFLASVLTGEYTCGSSGLRRPPLKDPSDQASDLYDSCVDNDRDPKIFVIFNDEQCYPSYLIKYCLR